ncbi:hypothetical protein COO60DRAFT_1709469 [Scenedesmus sp. NREL 46B-D3]|nr:hypothetical protein COO60DRAFT_1709469 [Scenedesmus sp. NREL 46B-D3]
MLSFAALVKRCTDLQGLSEQQTRECVKAASFKLEFPGTLGPAAAAAGVLAAATDAIAAGAGAAGREMKLDGAAAAATNDLASLHAAALQAGQISGPGKYESYLAPHMPFNDTTQAVDFETPLFKGKVLVMMRGLANTPARLFDGKRRLMWMVVQGRFKQPGVSFDGLCLGSEFCRPLKLPAGTLLSKASMWLVSKMGSGVQLDTSGSCPHILAPLIAAAQVVNVSGVRCLVAKAARQGRCFDTEHVWTFQVYDAVDLVQVLDGQPMQLLLKDTSSGLNMLKLEVWHRRMLEHKANSSSSSSSNSSSSTCCDMQGLVAAAAAARGSDDSPIAVLGEAGWAVLGR